MGYAVLGLGVFGLFTSLIIYFKVNPMRDLYMYGLLGYVLSWLVMVFGAWMVMSS